MKTMKLIDADALYNGAMKNEYFQFKESDKTGREAFAYSCAMERLVEAPAVDAAPVVRCKECRYYNTNFCGDGFGWCECNDIGHGTSDDWFCVDGEK